MKLLLANLSDMVDDTGGLAKVHCSFANEMKQRGHDVAMVFCDDKIGKPFFLWMMALNCIIYSTTKIRTSFSQSVGKLNGKLSVLSAPKEPVL